MDEASQKGRVLNVVGFSVPYPPVYGGVIDIFYKVKSLSELGVEVHLHCFEYAGSQAADELERVCASVTYYRRRTGLDSHMGRYPYVIASRRSRKLVENLSRSTGPILFEGLHTCAHIDDPAIIKRPKYIRMHNVEWEYYLFLSQTSNSWWKRMHFQRESRKLRRAERHVIKSADGIIAISQNDEEYFSRLHNEVNLIPPFHQFEDVTVKPGEGDYVLLQGDLSVDDNLRSVRELAKLCGELGIPCVIAGKAPSAQGKRSLEAIENIDLYLDVPEEQMVDLMHEAHIHVIHSSITSGFKLKLMAALFTARHIVARKILVSKPLREVVHTYSDGSEVRSLLKPLMMRPVTREDIAKRKSVLLPRFSNQANARLLMEVIDKS